MDRKKREVLINARFLTQTTTGVQRYAIEMIRALDKLVDSGHPLTHKYSFTLLSPRGVRQKLGLKNISLKQVGRLDGHPWEQLELPYHARHGLLLNLCNAAPLVKRSQVVVMHDAAVFANPQNFSFPFRNWYRILLTALGKVAKKIITVSAFSKGELVSRCRIDESKLRVTYEGGEHALTAAAQDDVLRKCGVDRHRYVLAVSSVSPNKNFSAVIRAVGMLGETDFKVVIAGGTNSRIFGGLGITLPDSVVHAGYVSDGELRSLYENADCFVYPSLYEGFGLPPLEAMTCGCPVIVSGTASMPEVCDDAVIYCDPHDPKDISEKIRRLMESADLRAYLRRKGSRRAKLFSWEKSARVALDVIEEASRSGRKASG